MRRNSTQFKLDQTVKKLSMWAIFFLRMEATVIILAWMIKTLPDLYKYFRYQNINDELKLKQGILASLEISLVLVILAEVIQLSFLGDRDLMGIIWILGILITHFAVNHMAKNGRKEIREEILKDKKSVQREFTRNIRQSIQPSEEK